MTGRTIKYSTAPLTNCFFFLIWEHLDLSLSAENLAFIYGQPQLVQPAAVQELASNPARRAAFYFLLSGS